MAESRAVYVSIVLERSGDGYLASVPGIQGAFAEGDSVGGGRATLGSSSSGIALEEFERLRAEIKPKPGESRWREIPWLTNITEARHRAVAEDKPLLIFTAADGSPLGRT